jgi:predicted ATP-dependent serine protease
MNSLICESCKRKLVDRYFDKCMYCGHPIPERNRLSKSEKDLIRSKKDQLAEEQRKEHEQYMVKRKEFDRKMGGDVIGGDSGGSGCGDG